MTAETLAGTPTQQIRAKALALGFDAVGFAPASLGPEARERLGAFIAAGQHGDMGWLAERTEERSQPRALWAEARSVVALGLSYAPDGDPLAATRRPDRGAISVYARHRDYHDVMKGMLKHLAQFVASRFGPAVKVFVDTAPVMEKPLAAAAGLGWQGKHTNLVSRAHGSWLFLGEIYTTLELPPDAPHADRCGSCTRCQAACPTDAFPAPYRLDATRCISYLTIEHRGPIPRAVATADGQPDLWLRRLPGRLPVEPLRPGLPPRQAAAAARSAGADAARPGSVGRCRVPHPVQRLPDQADRPRPLRPQRRRRARQLRRPGAARRGGGRWPPTPIPSWRRPAPGPRKDWRDAGPGMTLEKRSVTLAGHRTSVALEPEFWSALSLLAERRGQTLAGLVAAVDAARRPEQPLASALRVAALSARA